MDNALVSAAVLSNRYISDRFLPDKAIDLVDEACALIKTELDSMPTELDRYFAPATSAPISKAKIFLSFSPSGTSHLTIRWASREFGITKERFLQALSTVRGNQRVTSDNPEATRLRMPCSTRFVKYSFCISIFSISFRIRLSSMVSRLYNRCSCSIS